MSLLNVKLVEITAESSPLAEDEAKVLMESTPDWALDDHEIEREFVFSDFREAMLFVNSVAWLADKYDHHPEIEINYNRVELEFTTHSIGGLSQNDFIMAGLIDVLYRNLFFIPDDNTES